MTTQSEIWMLFDVCGALFERLLASSGGLQGSSVGLCGSPGVPWMSSEGLLGVLWETPGVLWELQISPRWILEI